MRRIVTVVYNIERHISITAYSPDEAKNAVIAKAVAAIIKRRLRGVTNRRS